MAFSFLEYLFFVLQILTFFSFANEESDDVIGGSTKTVKILKRSVVIAGFQCHAIQNR